MDPDRRLRVTYFGGTFDPPHFGHRALAEQVLALGRSDRVLAAPAWVPPHKVAAGRSAYADRLAMTRLAFTGCTGVEVSALEGELQLNPSYSVEVLAALSGLHPEWRIQLLIGGDSLLQLHTWHCPEELAARYEILTYPRAGSPVTAEQLRPIWGKMTEKLLSGVLEGTFFEISSSELRKRLANGENTDHIIADPVREYIAVRGLYRKGETNG